MLVESCSDNMILMKHLGKLIHPYARPTDFKRIGVSLNH